MSCKTLIPGSLFGLLFLTGCGNEFTLSSLANSGNGPSSNPGACSFVGGAKIEGTDIGTENVTLSFEGKTVTFFDWVAKDGEPGEFVGFSYSVSPSGAVALTVKSGMDLHDVMGTPWVNPNGTAGSEAYGISNITGCDPDDTDDPNDPDDPDDTVDPDDPADPGTDPDD